MLRFALILAVIILIGCLLPTLSSRKSRKEAGEKEEGKNTLFKEQLVLAEQGNAVAQAHVGYVYQTGEGQPQNLPEAMKWYRRAAEQGNVSAQVNLGSMLQKGEGSACDPVEAMKWWHNAADQGGAAAQFRLGYELEAGRTTQRNVNEAIEWYKKAADQGLAKAQYNLGNIYRKGDGVPSDLAEAFKWYQKAAEQGHANAQVCLGNIYSNGDGAPRDPTEAAKWYRKAADQGNATAEYNLGRTYYMGEGVTCDQTEAIKWWRKAGEQGHADAQAYLGLMYEKGKGVPRDIGEAVKWYRLASDQGNAMAQTNLGLLYYRGDNVSHKAAGAMGWLQWLHRKCLFCSMCAPHCEAFDETLKELTQEKTNSVVLWEADPAKDRILEAYKLWAIDAKKAFDQFLAFAQQGSIWCMNVVGSSYHKGNGVRRDLALAEEWYRRALNKGSNGTILSLNAIYGETGEIEKAEELNRIPIDQNFTPSMWGLAGIYVKYPRTRDALEKARSLYEKAVALGDLTAKRTYATYLMRGRFGLTNIPQGFRLTRETLKDYLALESKRNGASDVRS